MKNKQTNLIQARLIIETTTSHPMSAEDIKEVAFAIKPEVDEEQTEVKPEDELEDEANNDDYVEDEGEDDEEDDDEDDDDEDEAVDEEDDDNEDIVNRKTRKRKASAHDLDEDGDDDDGDDGEVTADVNDEDDGEGEEGAGDEEGEETGAGGNEEEEEEEEEQAKQGPKKRGRKRTKFLFLEEGAFDSEGNPIRIENDEVVIPSEDPKGKEKIDELGYLKGGREFKMKTFKLLGQGDRLYMISTEPARLVGFRDSYLLFKTHLTLFKRVCDQDEKMDLIQRGLIPNSYKGRSVNLVTARSIFREFGARMIKGGKKVIDDFWEQRAIDNGDIAGELADPVEAFPNQNKLSSIFGDGIGSGGAGGGASPLTATPIVNYQTDVTWMYQIAQQTQEYNKKLLESRLQATIRGSRDVYTNLIFYPESTQPKKVVGVDKFDEGSDKLVYDFRMNTRDLKRPVTGLANIPVGIIEDIEDEELKREILAQQEYEKSL